MFATIHRSLFFSRRLYVCGALCCVLAFGQTVNAQYKTIPPRVSGGAAKKLRTEAGLAFRSAANYQTNKDAIGKYYGQFYFPAMTAYSPVALGRLAKGREGILRQIRGSKVPAAQKQLTEISYKAMNSISRGDYHPAVRYNAVLLLGALDEKQAIGESAPVPHAGATQGMIELLENDEFNNVKVPASVKLGALVGLERHAHCGVAPEVAEKITQLALKLIAQEEPPADVDAEVYHWMKCQAARVLTRLHAKKADPKVQAALTAMINDSKMSLEDRCCVAELLARIDYNGAEGIDGAATVVALGNLMKQVVSDEARLAREYEKTKVSRRGLRLGQIEPVYQRSRLLSRVEAIGRGGTALKAGLSDDGKAQITSLLTPLGSVMIAAKDSSNIDLDVTREVKNLEGKINQIVDSWKKSEDVGDTAKEDFS